MIKDYLPRSLLGRSLLIVVTPLIVLQVVSGYIFYESHWDQVSKRLALGLAGDVAVLIETIRRFPNPEDRQWIFDMAERSLEMTATLEEGAILPNGLPDPTDVEGELRRALRDEVGKPTFVDARTMKGRVIIKVQLPEHVLTVVTPRHRLFSSTVYIFVLWTVGGALILVGVATMFMRDQVRPVLRLARAAEAFGKGRDVPSFKPEGAYEVRQAARAFIAMRARIVRQISQRTEMLAGVSHDLRTPLTRMKLQLAMMGEDDGVIALNEDVADMERMLEGYLAFARGEGREKPEPHDVVALLGEAVRQARRKGGTVDLEAKGEFQVPLRPSAFLRCITNLLENAQRYATHVSVRVHKRAKGIEVVIDDDGPGIPLDKREEVFKPFFRLESSRNPVTGGVGLGLTIARDVVRGHGGDIFLGESPSGGLRVRLRLPL
jgi:two-component system osmolarity sensor histidine kinase EnvZ